MNQTPDFTIKTVGGVTTDQFMEVIPQSDKAKEWVRAEFGHGAASFAIAPNDHIVEYWTSVKLAEFTVEFCK